MSYHLYKDYLEMKHAKLDEPKRYVVAFLSLHTGELFQHEYYAHSEVAAASLVLGVDFISMDQVHDYCDNTDSWISVLEINDTLSDWLGAWLQISLNWFDSSTCFQGT